LQAIELIDFCLKDITDFFDKTEKKQEVKQDNKLSEYVRPILSCLLSCLTKLSNSMKNLENIIPALDLITNIIGIL
jgi:hypothetical protein